MNIIIVGCGKVGVDIAKHIAGEDNINVTIIDRKAEAFDKAADTVDALLIKGNGLTRESLFEASVRSADLIICVTDSDETNILCCVTAKKFGVDKAVARVRDPEYYQDLQELRETLGIDLIINPEQQAAMEIQQLLRFPEAYNIETFMKGRVELISFRVEETGVLAGKRVSEAFQKARIPVLAALINRNGELIVPDGQTEIRAGDLMRILGRPAHLADFFRYLGIVGQKVKDVVVIGGGKVAHYLAELLDSNQMGVKIIEIDADRCLALSDALTNALVINGDGTDEEVLNSEGIAEADAVICLTDRDEDNVMIGLYSRQSGVPKVIVKINHINVNILRNLDIGSLVCPKTATTNQIVRYVRGLLNSEGITSINSLYRLAENGDDYVEAVEIEAKADSRCVGHKISELDIKKNVLAGCVKHFRNISIVSGSTVISEGDTVILLAKNERVYELDDILASDRIKRDRAGVAT